MTKSKTWEEEFDEKFIGNTMLDLLGSKGSAKNIRTFISQLVEKTRREAYQEGIKKGLKYAHALLPSPFKLSDKYDIPEIMKAGYVNWNAYHDEASKKIQEALRLENLKKEIKK